MTLVAPYTLHLEAYRWTWLPSWFPFNIVSSTWEKPQATWAEAEKIGLTLANAGARSVYIEDSRGWRQRVWPNPPAGGSRVGSSGDTE